MEKHKGFIWIISAGIGSKDFLTFKAYQTAQKMDVLVGASRFKDMFEHKNYIIKEKFIDGIDDIVINNKDKKIGVVVSGDAGFFSYAKTLYKRYSDKIADVIAGVSSFQVIFAKIMDGYEDAKFYTLHTNRYSIDDIDFAAYNKIVIICSNKNSPKHILTQRPKLIEEFQIFIGCNLSMYNESFVAVDSLNDIDSLRDDGFCIMVLKRRHYV